MTLIWSKNKNYEIRRAHEVRRNCGQLLGRLDELLPCLYTEHWACAGLNSPAEEPTKWFVLHPGP
jgi:hypothetical protein